jgi:hypothetical protein
MAPSSEETALSPWPKPVSISLGRAIRPYAEELAAGKLFPSHFTFLLLLYTRESVYGSWRIPFISVPNQLK